MCSGITTAMTGIDYDRIDHLLLAFLFFFLLRKGEYGYTK